MKLLTQHLRKLLAWAAVSAMSISSASAVVTWDFDAGSENGWSTVNGVSWLDGQGVGAGQAVGDGVDTYFGGVNGTADTRRAHDGAHVTFVYRSPTLNFAAVDPSATVLSVDWIGGDGAGGGAAEPTGPSDLIGGNTTAAGRKGLAFLNLTTGQYDTVLYKVGNSTPVDTYDYAQGDLTAAGISLTDDYQLDFFDSDDGGWGWTALSEIRLDDNAVVVIPEPSSTSLLLVLLGGSVFVRRRKSGK